MPVEERCLVELFCLPFATDERREESRPEECLDGVRDDLEVSLGRSIGCGMLAPRACSRWPDVVTPDPPTEVLADS